MLLKVTDVSDQTLARASGKYIETTVEYDFKLENVPDWQKSEKLEQIYPQSYGYSLEKVYRGSATMKKENGQYYNDAVFIIPIFANTEKIFMNRVKYLGVAQLSL